MLQLAEGWGNLRLFLAYRACAASLCTDLNQLNHFCGIQNVQPRETGLTHPSMCPLSLLGPVIFCRGLFGHKLLVYDRHLGSPLPFASVFGETLAVAEMSGKEVAAGLSRKRCPQSAKLPTKWVFFEKEDESAFPPEYLAASLLHAERLPVREGRVASWLCGAAGIAAGARLLCQLNESGAAFAAKLLWSWESSDLARMASASPPCG